MVPGSGSLLKNRWTLGLDPAAYARPISEKPGRKCLGPVSDSTAQASIRTCGAADSPDASARIRQHPHQPQVFRARALVDLHGAIFGQPAARPVGGVAPVGAEDVAYQAALH